MEKLIEFKSHWDTTLQNEYFEQNNSTLVILLPGLGYTTRGPLFHYCRKTAVALGFDVLSVDYGFQFPRKDYRKETDFSIVLQESFQIIQKCLSERHKAVIYIGKSLGTVLQNLIAEKLPQYHTAHIYLTPTNKTIDTMSTVPSLIFSGTADHLIREESIARAVSFPNVRMIRAEGASHSYETDDPLESIDILHTAIEAIQAFLLELQLG